MFNGVSNNASNKPNTAIVTNRTSPYFINHENDKKSDDMSWTHVVLRGVCGAIACGLYVGLQRTAFRQAFNPKDFAVIMGTCGIKAMGMSMITKGIRAGYNQFMPGENHQLVKDIAEAGIIDGVETAINYFSDKSTAKDVERLKVLGWSAFKSYPNNFMDTKSYGMLKQYCTRQDQLAKDATPEEEKLVKNREMFFKNFVMLPLVALATAVPGNILNNEPITASNLAKTVGLRVLSIFLWRGAMDIAEALSGDRKRQETKKEDNA